MIMKTVLFIILLVFCIGSCLFAIYNIGRNIYKIFEECIPNMRECKENYVIAEFHYNKFKTEHYLNLMREYKNAVESYLDSINMYAISTIIYIFTLALFIVSSINLLDILL